MFSPAAVTEEQLHAMWYACSEVSNQPDARAACRRLSDRLSEIIAAPTAILRRDLSPWRLIASSTGPAAGATALHVPPAQEIDTLVPLPAGYLPTAGAGDEQRWTAVPLDEESRSQWLLLLPGDWRIGPGAPWVPRFARTASMALRLAAARQSARRSDALAEEAYAFARSLGQLTGDRALHQLIIDTVSKSARARLGSLALFQPRDAAILLAATYGYPAEAVGHVRIVPGSGIIGGVFASRRPLLVRDTAQVPGLAPRRRRYQTGSFMAVPIVSGGEALGVITLADRDDGRPFSRGDLTATRVITALSSLALVRERLEKLTDELAHAAAIDPLTTLFNRRYLHTRLNAELERSRRTGMPVALLMIDVDGFKAINDQMGHQTGDAVLRKVAEIVKRSVRASDVCTRYGGDELSIIVHENAATAEQTGERIRQRVEAFRWDSIVPQALHVTVSVGVAIADIGEGSDTLIGRADQNLYDAKARGRNRVVSAREDDSR